MKKRVLVSVLVAVSSIVIGLPSEIAAAESGQVTYITGQVEPPQYDPFSVAGFRVYATCHDPFTHDVYGSGSDITDADGGFLIILSREKCPEDSRIFAGADRGSEQHFGHARNFYTNVINSKLIIRQSPISMIW